CSFYNGAGLHGNSSIHTKNNQNQDLLLSLEQAQVMATMLDRSFWNGSVDDLWRDVLSCTGHAIEWIWKEDYAERLAKSRHTRLKARGLLEDSLCAMAGGIPFAPNRGSPLVVFNFHAWPISGPVQFAVDNGVEGLRLRDSTGKNVPLQFVDENAENGPQVAFCADAVPACGFKTYYLTHAKQGGLAKDTGKIASSTIENEHFRITASPTGQLEVFDKDHKKILGSPQVGGLGDVVVYDMPPSKERSWMHNGPAGRRRDWQPDMARCRAVEGPVFDALRIPGKIGPHSVVREVRLWRNSDRIEFGVELDTQSEDNAILCIRFPIGLSGKVVAGIPFGVESRDHLDQEPFRGEFFCLGFPEGYYATRWTDVSSPDFGYTFICPPGMHTGYVFKKADQSIEFILNRFQPMPTDAFSRSALSITGTGHNRWRCALFPHTGTWREAQSYRQALEEHVPLMAWSPGWGLGRGGASSSAILNKPERPNKDGALPIAISSNGAASLVEVRPAGVILSSMRLIQPEKPGEATQYELRLYETLGKETDVVVRLARPAIGAQMTNFLGEPMPDENEVQLVANELHFHIKPWKIVTLRVRDR
ncbi:MAG: glycoside hydrolase family 38 C-terminal domain-containing protein, partial [Thermoguttaceae bacterium]